MNTISEMGETILDFIGNSYPEYVRDFYPGISRSKIGEILPELEHSLPDDFYELYAWKNGNPESFPAPPYPTYSYNWNPPTYGYDFDPMDVENDALSWEWYGESPPTHEGHPLIPFITLESEFLAITIGCFYSKEPHIVYVDEVGETYLYCDSITSLLKSTVDCFTSNALIIDNQGYLRENRELIAEIWRTNNPLTLAMAMSNLRKSLEFFQLEHALEEETYALEIDSLLSTLRTLTIPRPKEATILFQGILTQICHKNSRRQDGLKLTLEDWLQEAI